MIGVPSWHLQLSITDLALGKHFVTQAFISELRHDKAKYMSLSKNFTGEYSTSYYVLYFYRYKEISVSFSHFRHCYSKVRWLFSHILNLITSLLPKDISQRYLYLLLSIWKHTFLTTGGKKPYIYTWNIILNFHNTNRRHLDIFFFFLDQFLMTQMWVNTDVCKHNLLKM